MSKTRFDLEENILDCWRVVDDLKIISDSMKRTNGCDPKESIAVTEGMAVLYNEKFERLFDTFKQVFEVDEYYNP